MEQQLPNSMEIKEPLPLPLPPSSPSPSSSSSPQSIETQNELIIPKMKNSKRVIILSSDNQEYELETELIINMCKTVKNIVKGCLKFKNSLGGWFTVDGESIFHKREDKLLASINKNTEEEIKIYFSDIRGCVLNSILEFCKFHSTNTSPILATQFDFNFIQKKPLNLCELASASYFLDIKSLVSLTSKEIATQISQKSAEELRQTFSNLQITEPRDENFEMAIMSLKRGSRSELEEAVARHERMVAKLKFENKSLDEILEFIGEDEKKSKKSKKSKSNNTKNINSNHFDNNKINSKSKNKLKNKNENEKEKEKKTIIIIKEEIIINNQNNENNHFNRNNIINIDDYNLNIKDEEGDDGDGDGDDDEIDPVLQEEIDREIAIFKERLESFNRQIKLPHTPCLTNY
ncbi:hypothetical protein DDB_G0284889 [Dictyostelium discoideum AX4]|uniref:SKP1 component dimerisation domain-containing protein n=1 Tax=Dictyostelium discoideum TaxID=44689 RepID=Q54P05_DICDI|nr:hypothetical protein DDB_G0284889 [Dictyostelium discoideum AX4]EAL64908.1 hypothetical protein DDB_G0284889 [Dictyostelium discoideum AX4]|eukprot:XP_639912.1 hypothetical protein DDB_G0284889 [Dictyostelium discoideum AX4]